MRWLQPSGPDAFDRTVPSVRGARCETAAERLEEASDIAAEEQARAQQRRGSKFDRARIYRRAVIQGRA